MKKPELGQVYFLTTFLHFPLDNDEWVTQDHIPASTTWGILQYISNMKLSVELKKKLCNTLECSWKDQNGVWWKLKIEMTRRNEKWGTPLEKKKLILGAN